MTRKLKVQTFQSFEEENEAEAARRAAQFQSDRLHEFETLQERMWGQKWRAAPIKKVATWEKITW